MRRFTTSTAFFLLLTAAGLYPIALDFQASIDRNQLSIDDNITVTVQISGENIKDNLPFPEPDASQDFKLENKNSYQSSSQNISIINGRMMRSVVKTFTFQYTFKPLKTGQLQLPGFKFQYEDFQKTVSPTTVTVGKEAPEARDVDLVLKFSKPSLYINEQGLLSVSIRQKANSSVNGINPPDIEKELKKYFWIKPMADKWGGHRENIGAEVYNVYAMNYIVFPIMEGKVRIPSIPLQYSVVERQARRRSPDPFMDDAFFNNFFGGNVTTRNKTKYSAPVTVDVKSVPGNGRPQDYAGAVGEFTLNAVLDKKEVKAGEALNLKVTVTGKGNEKSVNSLHLSNADKFEVFDPEIQAGVEVRNNQVFVTKTFKYVLIPQVEGQQPVGPVTLFFFNPAKGAYDSAQARMDINVLKGKVAQASPGRYLSKEEIRLVGKDIRYIKTDAAGLHNQARRFHRSALFILLMMLPFLYTGAFLVFRRHTERLKTDVEYARQKKAKKQAAKLLARAHGHIKAAKADEFYAALHKSLTGYIADKLNIPAAALSGDDAGKQLQARMPQGEALIREVTQLLQECEMHRFASVSETAADRSAKYAKAEELLTRLARELKS
jgi:hypothetical protein